MNEVHAQPIAPAGPAEFEIPLVAADSDEAENESPVTPAPSHVQTPSPNPQPVAAAEEVDLSDEWEAMIQEVEGTATAAPDASGSDGEIIEIVDEPAPAPVEREAAADEISVPAFEIVEETVADEPVPETSATVNDDIELLLTPEPPRLKATQ